MSTSLAVQARPHGPGTGAEATGASAVVVLDNARVRVLKASTSLAIRDHPAAVVVPLEEGAGRKAGAAYWSGDPAPPDGPTGTEASRFIIVEPKEPAPPPPARPTAIDAGPKPDRPPFTGMSFTPLFENDRVRVVRGRMDVGAVEGFHTHTSDIVVVHLSGGVIEDTANGNTKISRWKTGDVEFEPRGSSHSARNAGDAVDAVLVTLKP
jgi:quercetin dioxygenase-like cupin family protein